MLDNLIINGIEVNWARAELLSEGNAQSLEPKLMAVLTCLIKANGDIVSQQQLLEQVWGETVVSPNTVQRCITQLRKLFNDDSKQQSVIQTHPKLGYSLVLKSVSQTQQIEGSNAEKPDAKQRLAIIFIGLITLAFLLLSNQSNSPDISVPKFTQIRPITTNNEVIETFSIANNGDIYNVIQDGETHKLVKHDANGSHQVLRTEFKIFGELTLNPDQTSLTYGHQYLVDNKKCVDLVSQHIDSGKKEVLLPCTDSFNHSASWINDNKLVFLQYDKSRQSRLSFLNTGTKRQKSITLPDFEPLFAEFNPITQLLLVTGRKSVLTMSYDQKRDEFAVINRQKLSFENEGGSRARWYAQSLWFINHEQKIHWFNDKRALTNTSTLSNSKILAAKATEGKLVVVLGRRDWNSRVRHIADSTDSTDSTDSDVSPTSYKEQQGQFQPNGTGTGTGTGTAIAFLTDRLGHSQLWLNKDDSTKRLSADEHIVSSFIWHPTGQSVFYLADNAIWSVPLDGSPTELKTRFSVTELFQSKEQHLLLSVEQDSQYALVWYNIENSNSTRLLNEEVEWAQHIDASTFITNDSSGKLLKYQNGEYSLLNGLDDLIIQWRYFWRKNAAGNFLYFQDKKQNLWHYDVLNGNGTVIGHYDKNSLFMTDFDATNQRMLSDNFVAETKSLFYLNEVKPN